MYWPFKRPVLTGAVSASLNRLTLTAIHMCRMEKSTPDNGFIFDEPFKQLVCTGTHAGGPDSSCMSVVATRPYIMPLYFFCFLMFTKINTALNSGTWTPCMDGHQENFFDGRLYGPSKTVAVRMSCFNV